MKVILLEKVYNLGELGDSVEVKSGYARNFLLPQGKALRATKDNIAYFEAQRKSIEKQNADTKKTAEKDAKTVDGADVTIIRQAADSGKLYGSVTARDIAQATTEATGITVNRNQVVIIQSYKTLGIFPITVQLHPEVSVEVSVNIARSPEEAKLQKERGGALILEPGENIAEAKEEAPVADNVEELFDKQEDAEAAKAPEASEEEAAPAETAEQAEETSEEEQTA